MKRLFLFIKQKRLLLLTGVLLIVVGVLLIRTWVPSVWGPVRLFLLVYDVGVSNTKVIIAPYDFRESSSIKTAEVSPKWIAKLYENIRTELQRYQQ